MKRFLSDIHVLALAAGVALTSPALAAPLFVTDRPAAEPDIIRVQESSTVVRRKDEAHHDSVWKKRRHHYRERRDLRDRDRHEAHDFDGRGRQFQPKATSKYAYDAYGNLRVFDRNRKRDYRNWDHRDGWRSGDDYWHGEDWYEWKRESGPRIYKLRKSRVEDVPSALDDILTAVPD